MAEQDVKKLGYDLLDSSIRKRLVINVEAPEKSGKTDFALNSPGPIGYADFDTGLEGVGHKFASKKKIHVKDYTGVSLAMRTPGAVVNYAAMYEGFAAEQMALLQDPYIRTVVWDTGSEAWELLRMARFGKLMQVMPHQYGPVNAEFRRLIRLAFAMGKNLVMLHKMQDEYINDKSTGRLKRQGFKDAAYMSQINVLLFRDAERRFQMQIKDCRMNPAVDGLILDITGINPWPLLGTLVFPDTQEADWL